MSCSPSVTGQLVQCTYYIRVEYRGRMFVRNVTMHIPVVYVVFIPLTGQLMKRHSIYAQQALASQEEAPPPYWNAQRFDECVFDAPVNRLELPPTYEATMAPSAPPMNEVTTVSYVFVLPETHGL